MAEKSKAVWTLDNGLDVLLYRNSRMYEVGIAVGVKYGVVHDPAKHEGLAHLTEHMLFTGTNTKTYPEVFRAFERLRAGPRYTENAYTGSEETIYYMETFRKNISPALALYAEIFRDSTITHEALNGKDGRSGEKQVVLMEKAKTMQEPYAFLASILWQEAFKGHPAGSFGLGTEKTINSVTVNDLLNVHRRYYTPDNIVVAVAGDIKQRSVLRAVDKYFKTLEGKAKPAQVSTVKDLEKERSEITLERAGLQEALFAIGFRTPPMGTSKSTDEHIALEILAHILEVSVFERLRANTEFRGLVYHPEEAYQWHAKHYGLFYLMMGVLPDTLEKVKSHVFQVIEDIHNGDVKKKDLRRAIEIYTKGLMYNYERNPSDSAVAHVEYYIRKGSPYFSEDFVERASAITPEYLKTIAWKYLNLEKATVVTVLPKKETEIFRILRPEIGPTTESEGNEKVA